MQAINIDTYIGNFQSGGVVRGCDLPGLTESRLAEMGIVDDLHRQIIMECLDELIKGSSSLVRTCMLVIESCPYANELLMCVCVCVGVHSGV